MFSPYEKKSKHTQPRRDDPDDIRIGYFVQSVEGALSPFLEKMKEGDFVILGYPDDRGVERNFGRIGACEAPDAIRDILYSMTPSPQLNKSPTIWDLGNLKTWSMDLLEAQEEARKVVALLRSKKTRLITLGGGHDWAWSDFADWGAAPLINFDAHLDMRPSPQDSEMAGHSGTPFRRIVEKERSKLPLSVVGLQNHCNSKAHLDWARAFQVNTIFLEELPPMLESQWKLLMDRMELGAQTSRVGLSVDMDCFPQSMAPGVSAPQALGVNPFVVLRFIETFGPKLQHLGIYECNPRYDVGDATSRLAAKLIHNFLHSV